MYVGILHVFQISDYWVPRFACALAVKSPSSPHLGIKGGVTHIWDMGYWGVKNLGYGI